MFCAKLLISIALLGSLAQLSQAHDPLADSPLVKDWLAIMRGEKEDPAQPKLDTFVTIRNGTIKGKTAYTVGNHVMYEYLGVPYAKPPVGSLRFLPPQPSEGWGGAGVTFDATKQPHACPQYLTNVTIADEDCLFLSIYSRRYDNSTGLLPVIYFIHGGGYAVGQTSYYPGRKLLNEEVVFVTVQYRLGPLGFLCTEDDAVSANNAMKDMVQGLRWVQENIGAFGGDPNQVTVMGESAGSASALYMLISPLAQGLFNKVIAMSGTPLQEWAIDRKPLESARKIANLLNCTDTETGREIVACLKDMDWMPMAQAGLAVILDEFMDFKMVLSGSTPCIEGDIPGAFLPDEPLKLLLEGPLPDVPVMLGTVQHEGTLPLIAAYFLKLGPEGLVNDTQYVRDYLVGDMLATYGVNERRDGGSVSQALAAGYFPPGVNRQNFTEMQYHLMDMLSAVFMKGPVLRTADILSRRLSSVYLYSFEHYNRINSLFTLAFAIIEPILGGEKPPIRPGTMHADDLIYMFDFPFILNLNDIAFSRKYCRMFTNFVLTGSPTPEPSEDYPDWPTYNIDTQQYMKLALNPEVKTDYMDSWRQGMLPV
ncbi:unnamed protein product [Orchesella dallaii]|uniref:Carboxylic ester hydrolase n=1 Tax=Orchesella dallaii TaxID=48710 RepID=A0ABP1R8P0_9HEXA